MNDSHPNSFHVSVTSDNVDHLRPAITLAFSHPVFSHAKATHYRIIMVKGTPTLIELFWCEPPYQDKATPLPFPMDARACTAFLKGYLRNLTMEDWGPSPDCDGDVIQGYTLTTSSDFFGFLTLTTTWIVYGK